MKKKKNKKINNHPTPPQKKKKKKKKPTANYLIRTPNKNKNPKNSVRRAVHEKRIHLNFGNLDRS